MQAREWVNLVRVAAVALGMANASLAAAQESSAGENEAGGAPRTEYILAVSWQPGFCETRPDRKECVDQTARRFDATHFSLHGLWPLKKSYCGVEAELKVRDRKGDWLDLPEVAVQDETAKRLLVAMPGVKSGPTATNGCATARATPRMPRTISHCSCGFWTRSTARRYVRSLPIRSAKNSMKSRSSRPSIKASGLAPASGCVCAANR